jgi:hypothetical protein
VVPGARRPKKQGKIAQRTVPHDLRPDVLREELIELGDAFRVYQDRPEPDLALLAGLHDRKARAFALWADLTGDSSLSQEAERACTAARTTREMQDNRVGIIVSGTADGNGGVVKERMLSRSQAAHARSVLAFVQADAPCPEAGVHLAVLMLTLRAARAGTGNLTGQDVTGWLQDDAERVLDRLVTSGWLQLPGTAAEAIAAPPEDFTSFTVPSLLPGRPRPAAFGKTTRSRISGWAQKTVGDRKLRKKKLRADTRLLALYTAVHTRPDGSLGPAGHDGLALDEVSAFTTLPVEQITEHAQLLVAADWLAHADSAEGRLRGQLAERVLPLGGVL